MRMIPMKYSLILWNYQNSILEIIVLNTEKCNDNKGINCREKLQNQKTGTCKRIFCILLHQFLISLYFRWACLWIEEANVMVIKQKEKWFYWFHSKKYLQLMTWSLGPHHRSHDTPIEAKLTQLLGALLSFEYLAWTCKRSYRHFKSFFLISRQVHLVNKFAHRAKLICIELQFGTKRR